MRAIASQVNRFVGRVYPVRDIEEIQAVHGRLGAHVESEWTTPEHWAPNTKNQGR